MKTNSIISVLALCTGLSMASCSQEEIVSGTSSSRKVAVQVNIPVSDASSRTLPTVPEGYQLRCMMDLVDADGNVIEGTERQVQAVTTDNLTFMFDAPEGAYSCLFWADYVPVSSDVNTDNLYNTANLTAVGYVETGNELFNNDAADAFYGSVSSGLIGNAVNLTRPFARVNVAPNSKITDQYVAYDQVAVSYAAPSGFNVMNGTTSSTVEVSYSGSTSENYWFSSYIFTSADKVSLSGDMSLTLTDTEAVEDELNLEISGSAITVDGNRHVNVNVTPSEGGTEVSVTFPGDMQDPNAPHEMAIGDFLYSDGTFGTEWKSEGTIGIVYALADGKTDNSTYESFDGRTIKGYAMATTGVARITLTKDDVTLTPSETPWASGNYSGYANTESLRAVMPEAGMFTSLDSWVEGHAVTAANLSGWYIPSARQLQDITGGIFGWTGNGTAEAVEINEALAAAYATSLKNGGMTILSDRSADGDCNVASSSAASETNICVVQMTKDGDNISIKELRNVSVTGSAVIRPVLTIFE